MTSAYPAPLDELIPQARQLAAETGQLPSRNMLKRHFRIGAEKANRILAALTEPDQSDQSGRRLHAVPDTSDHHDVAPADQDAPPDTDTVPVSEPVSSAVPDVVTDAVSDQASPTVSPDTTTPVHTARITGWTRRMPRSWPLILLALPAFVAIWSGWVGLGELTGFGPVHPLPGIASGFTLNTAITLPIGVETYAAYALRVWLAGAGTDRARRFAKWSAIGSLVLGAAGQVAYHLMSAQHVTAAPWPITTAVACLPVVVLGFGAALAHLQHHTTGKEVPR